MTLEPEVLKTWNEKKPDEMCTFTTGIIMKLTGNTDFTNPPITLTELGAANHATSIAYANRKNGAHARSVLEASASAQNTMLIKIADYVTSTAYGDATKILSTGFSVTKAIRTKAVIPDAPVAPKLSCNNGNLYLNTKKVAGAKNYCWIVYLGEVQPVSIMDSQLNVTTLVNTIIVPAGATRECVKGIAAGTKVTVMVLAQNVAGKSAFSTSASMYINC